MTTSSFHELRDGISHIDREIVRLLNQRAQLSVEIGKIKAQRGMEVYDPSREKKIYKNAERANEGALPLASLRAIFREILSASRVLQSPVTVAYLGPEASFAHLAAQSHFGTSSRFFPQTSIGRVFDEVEREKVKWGVVPVENSIAGSVTMTMDKLLSTTLNIRAEIFQRITHSLLSLNKEIADIGTVYSHPLALAQCQAWLLAHVPRAATIGVESTSAAVRRVLQQGENNVAAIGSREAAFSYGLNILAEGIEDKVSNTTRFLVIGKAEGRSTGNDKTSLLFSTHHKPGSLYHALKPFADRGVNMMKIESYPVKDRLWEYYFFLDVAGHCTDDVIKECLDSLRQKTTLLRILGSYPRSEDA